MRISLGDLNYYRQTLDGIATQAGEYVRDAIQSLGGGSGVTAMREAAIEAIQESVGIHGEMAQALAGQLFDEVCAAEGMGPFDFELMDDIIDFGMLEEKVRYFARALVEGNGDRFLDDCTMLADFYAKRCNYESMVRNCAANGVRYARVPTGTDTCDFCLMLASRGFVYYDRGRAEEGSHMHCVVANTRVSAYDLLGAERRYYQGPLVHIVTAGGDDLTITPNHPILTTNGWIAAGEVNDGDYLVCACFDHRGVSNAPDEHHIQPKIEDVFRSLRFLNPSGFHTVPISSEDFHGDGTVNGEVDVVWADGLLKNMGNVPSVKPVVHECFVGAGSNFAMIGPRLFGDGVSDLLHERGGTTTDGIVGGFGLSGAFGAGHPGSLDSLGFSVAPSFDPNLVEPSEQGGAGDTVAFSECKETLARFVSWKEIIRHGDSSPVRPANLGDVDADSLEVLAKGAGIASKLASDGTYGFPIPVKFSRVIHKSVSVSTCQVYNLTTSTSWYFANNIITHNCDCVTVCGGAGTTIEGYDPDTLYDLWQGRISETASSRAGRNGTSYQVERMRIMDSYKASARRAHARRRYR